MKLVGWATLTYPILGWLLAVAPAVSGAGSRTERIDQAAAAEPAISKTAVRELANTAAEAVDQLARMLDEAQTIQGHKAARVLHGLALDMARPGANAEREAFSSALCRQLSEHHSVEVKRFLITQLQITAGDESLPALAACLAEPELAEAARQALLANGSTGARRVLREALPKTTGRIRIGLIQALGLLRDKEADQLLLAEAGSAEEQPRLAAFEALAQIGIDEAEPLLGQAMEQGSQRVQRAVTNSYLKLADRLLARGASEATGNTATPPHQDLALRMYGRVLKSCPMPALRCAAVAGARQAGSAALEVLLPGVADPDDTVRDRVFESLGRLPGKEVSSAISNIMGQYDATVRAGLVHVLAKRVDETSRRVIERAGEDASAEVRVTAWQVTGRLDAPGDEMQATLQEAADQGSPRIRPVAWSALLKLARNHLGGETEAQMLPVFERALGVAGLDQVRYQAIQELASEGGESALPLVEKLMKDPVLGHDATLARIAIAGRLDKAGRRERGVAILREIVEARPARQVLDPAVRALRGLGIAYDPAHETGFVTRWWLVGPFPGNDIDKVWSPEERVDLQASVAHPYRRERWRPVHVTDPAGIVHLLERLEPNHDVTCYLYAEITPETAGEVVLKIGSNDGTRVWINGQMVHTFPGSRGLKIDEDTARAKLDSGVNRILVKVTQGPGDWAFCLRLTDAQAHPLRFTHNHQ